MTISAAWLSVPFWRVFGPAGDLFWPYLLSSGLLAAAVVVARGPRSPEAATSLRRRVFPPAIYRHPSARLDFRYFVVNAVLYAVLIGPFLMTSPQVARASLSLLMGWLGVPQAPLHGGPLFGVVSAAALALALDLGFFLAHLLQHKVPVLWAFHKVHHSAEVLHPVTSFRSHPADLILDFTVMATLSGAAMALIAYLFDDAAPPLTILGVNAFVFAFNVAGFHLRHSHIPLGFGPVLSRLFVSPRMHQLHHSCAEAHRDRNLGGILSIWDALAGTLYLPRNSEAPVIGLLGDEGVGYDSVWRLYWRPFREVAHLLVCRSPSLVRRRSA